MTTLEHAGHNVFRMPMGTECAAHKHREWVPIEAHHIWPLGMGGPDTPDNKVKVCANGHYSIHEFIRQLMLTGGKVPGTTSRHFNNKIKALARQGWSEAGSPTHASHSE